MDFSADESDEEEEEENQDANIFLVTKENLWQLLSKCQEPGCPEECEITTQNKGTNKGKTLVFVVVVYFG